MAKFIEIEKINSYGEKGKALINVDDIIGIKEKHVESEKLYDENGNVVQETPKERQFGVLVVSERGTNEVFYVDETEYKRLVQVLTNPTK